MAQALLKAIGHFAMRVCTLLALLSLSVGALRPAPTVLGGSTEAHGKPVRDAVVWLEAPDAPAPRHRPEPVLDQNNLQFSPHVLAIQVGTTIRFPNDDRVFHNVFSTHDGTRFDLGLYPVGAVKEVPFDKVGLSRVFCSIHPQMAAYIMVVATPYFAVSDASGHFQIADVPPGHYRYHAWRPGAAELADRVDVGSGAALVVRWP